MEASNGNTGSDAARAERNVWELDQALDAAVKATEPYYRMWARIGLDPFFNSRPGGVDVLELQAVPLEYTLAYAAMLLRVIELAWNGDPRLIDNVDGLFPIALLGAWEA